MRSATDALTTADSAGRTGTFIRSATDSLTTAEAITRGKVTARSASDALATSEAPGRTGSFGRATTDAPTTAESAAATKFAALTRTAVDGLSLGGVGTPTADDSYVTIASYDLMYGGYRVGAGEVFVSQGGKLAYSTIQAVATGGQSGNFYSKVYTAVGGLPGTLLATSDPIDTESLASFVVLNLQFTFSGANQPVLAAGTQYVVTYQYGGPNGIYYYFDSGDHGNHGLINSGGWSSYGDINFGVYVQQSTTDVVTAVVKPAVVRTATDALTTSDAAIITRILGRSATDAPTYLNQLPGHAARDL